MIEFIVGVMDWLERRHCAVCGQYVGDDRECQKRGVCAQGAVSARGPMTLLRPSAAAWCCRAGPCERCLKAYEGHQINEKLHPE
jgi:hypothetical protein